MADTKKRGGRRRATTTNGRRPTYGAATRLARLVFGLIDRPYGWSFDAIRDELGISERTLLRYLAACRHELVDAAERPILEVSARGKRRVLRLAGAARAQDSTVYEALLLYFALTVFQFLDGTVIRDGVEGLWERLRRALPPAQQPRLADFERKFFSVPHAVKDYRDCDEILDRAIRAVVFQQRLRIDYRGLLGEGKTHDFDAYTLTMYRGGLYLIGHSHLRRKIIWLAIERIRGLETLPQRFDYPKRYSPQKHTEGIFGIVDGAVTQVELLLLSDKTVAYLASRKLHPTQKFQRRRDGKTVLTMTVRGTAELLFWILGLGPWVEVLRPRELREEVAAMARRTARIYPDVSRRRSPLSARRVLSPADLPVREDLG